MLLSIILKALIDTSQKHLNFLIVFVNGANKATKTRGAALLDQAMMQTFFTSAQRAPCTSHYDYKIYSYCKTNPCDPSISVD